MFLYWQKLVLLHFGLIHKMVSTELLDHLYCVGLNVGNQFYLSMMNFVFHIACFTYGSRLRFYFWFGTVLLAKTVSYLFLLL